MGLGRGIGVGLSETREQRGAHARRSVEAYQVEPAVLPSGEFATVLTLRDSMCKWPIGDPASSSFRFCGRKTGTDDTYCEAHADMAYQPSQKRRRRNSDAAAALDAIAATRRYNF